MIWLWANDPHTRQFSFNPESIEWEQHRLWFSTRLSNPETLHYVAEDEFGVAVGQIRFDAQSVDSAAIDISVDCDRRRQGFGVAILSAACDTVFDSTSLDSVVGEVKAVNQGSIRTFECAGFSRSGERGADGSRVLLFTRQRRHNG